MPDKMATEPAAWIISANDLAHLIGLTVPRVHQLVKEGMPKIGRGQFHGPTCVQWCMGRQRETKARNLNEQRQALYKQQTEKAALENRVARGELLDVNQVQTALFSLATLISTQLQAIEPRLSRQLNLEQRDLVRAEISAAQESIAHEIETFATTRDGSNDHPAAA